MTLHNIALSPGQAGALMTMEATAKTYPTAIWKSESDMNSTTFRHPPVAALGATVLVSLLLGGCGRDMHDLQTYVAEIRLRKPAGIEALPEIKPYEKLVVSQFET